MKKISQLILGIFLLLSTQGFSQTKIDNTVIGVVTEVKPKFMGAQTLLVNETELVLMANQEDASGNTFEINKEYKDILVKKDAAFMLNPKYANKMLKFTYAVNGKGWKCISTISNVKCSTPKKNKSSQVK